MEATNNSSQLGDTTLVANCYFLVHVRKIHPGNELQPGNLPCVVMHFQVGFHDGDVNELTLGGILALYSHAVQFQITVMSEDEFVDYGGVHDY